MKESSDQEPQFQAISRGDPEIAIAHEKAADSIDAFRDHVVRLGEHDCWAKLRFRDPDLSDELGEDRFLFLWLIDTQYHQEDQLFSAGGPGCLQPGCPGGPASS